MNVTEVFNEKEIRDMMHEGNSMQDIQKAIDKAESGDMSSLKQSYEAGASGTTAGKSNTYFSPAYQENLIKFQLNPAPLLEIIEHMLRGDNVEFKDGNTIWTKETDAKKVLFNDKGVAEIMRILACYVTPNTFLSNYDEKTIRVKVYDLGIEIADLIYLKYNEFGLDTIEKRKCYPIIVREIVDVVHSSYLRALNGREMDSLREGRQVNQSDSMAGGGVTVNTGPSARERGLLNPARYISGKFK